MKLSRKAAAWIASIVLVGCGTAETPPPAAPPPPPPPPPTGLTVYPATTLYTGVEDRGAKYMVNIAVSGATGVTWTSADPTIATVKGDDTSGTVTTVKAGSTSITAASGQQKKVIPVMVQSYKATDRMAGQGAWNMIGCAKSGCHDAAGPDISPSGIAKHDDAALIAAATMGKNPEGGDISIGAAAHSFVVPNTAGLAAYLRSLAPKQIPKADD